MYQFTQEDQKPYIHILCECGRKFKREELYCCVSCSKIQCRFCTQVQVHSYFCRNCLHTTNLSEVTIRYHCQNCFECPLCRHTLTEMKEQSTEKVYLYCQFCSWNSISINFIEEKSKDLANKCIVKMKEKADPQQKHFQKVLSKYKELQMQIEKERKIKMNPKIGKKMNFSNYFGSPQIDQLSKNWSFDKFNDQQKAKEEEVGNQMYNIDLKGLMTYKLVKEDEQEGPQNPENLAQNLENFYCEDFDSLQEELNNFVNLKNYELLTTSEDCLKYPLLQPKHKAGMVPIPVQLQSRKIRTCCDCKKIIIKPDSSHTQITEFKLAFFLYEYCPLIHIRKIHYNKVSDEFSVVLVMENESEQYTMNVQLDNLEEDFEFAQIHNYQNHDYYQLIVLRKERVEMKVVDFLDINKAQSTTSAPTQQLFEFIIKLKQDKPLGIDVKFGFQMNLDVEYESDKSYSFVFPVVINLGKLLDQI
ncbi:hypothetical protein ABPG74_010304 [Tetrahymena malaccensis]